jgi:hypothetical protein
VDHVSGRIPEMTHGHRRVHARQVARVLADATGFSEEEVKVLVLGGAALTVLAVGIRIFDTIETVRSAVRA